MSSDGQPTGSAGQMNGAQALLSTLVASGVTECFANPGTSEMSFVAALDTVPGMTSHLALFEGVATGAADGYARIAGHPAATLLHLGPGLGNGLANLHNARRAHTPVVNLVGDHATFHQRFDAPLQSDIGAIARGASAWIHTAADAASVADDGASAVAAARSRPGRVATLVLPADVSWSPAPGAAEPARVPGPDPVSGDTVASVARALRSGEPAALLVGGGVCGDEDILADADRVAAATDAKLLAEVFPPRLRRGAGIAAVERLGYLAEFAETQLAGLRHLVLVDARAPVSFFAYPDKSSDLVPDGCTVHVLAEGSDEAAGGVAALAEAVGAAPAPRPAAADRPERPSGELDAATVGTALAATLPEEAIVVDEGNTSGLFSFLGTGGCPPHDWLCLTGGAIGYGMPAATGAAVAAGGRRVINLEADGSAMYTVQALWTQANEGLDVTTVILNNHSYAILNMELDRVGAETGPEARRMLDLSPPSMDFVAMAEGMGVAGTRVDRAEDLARALSEANATEGPCLIDAQLPARL